MTTKRADVQDILEEASWAVITATVLAVVLTVVERLNHTEGGIVDDLAKAAWLVWAFSIAAWVTVVLLDAFVPFSDEGDPA